MSESGNSIQCFFIALNTSWLQPCLSLKFNLHYEIILSLNDINFLFPFLATYHNSISIVTSTTLNLPPGSLEPQNPQQLQPIY